MATAEEAFFVSTPFVLMPVTRFNGQTVGMGAVGPMTRYLIDSWSKMVGMDIIAQAKQHAKEVEN